MLEIRKAAVALDEKDLMELIPKDRWIDFGHAMIFHGRRICDAKQPLCDACPVDDLCPKVGVRRT